MFGTQKRLPIEGVGKQYLKTRQLELMAVCVARSELDKERRGSSRVPKFRVNDLVMVLESRMRKNAKRPYMAMKEIHEYEIKR
ncbi:hypothetical protein AYI69_g6708 [Smittium culicis]|uniref:Uncharacterized protein n=1 Tax=Smittium culicis TaxID=133412 RepID=A0A1R1XXB0_9FUNG|nr:hypothetical protein AYI69_g6708 [Smittium culicis]